MNTSKIIKAYIRDGTYSTTEPITQGDYGYILQIEGVVLPSVYRVDFSNDRHKGEALPVYGNENGVEVPEELIVTGKDIFAFYFYLEEGFGKTVYTWKIPNNTRAQNGDREPTPTQQSVIDQAISALNSAVAQTAQDVIDADASAQSASDDADRAEEAKTDAQNYASSANTSSDAAYRSASSAQLFASQAETSAQTAEQIKDDVEGMVDDAQASANASAQSASASANSASQASASATSAIQASSNASDMALSAQTYSEIAQSHATQAGQSAQTASAKATESAQSATNAQGYAQTAEQAKTSAQTAQGLAESARDSAITAQESAEDARDEAQTLVDSISGKTEQIDQNTADIASLEEDRYKPYATDSAIGSIASFVDGADDIPLKSLVVNIDPVQDLHGYDSPWVAGGGKNLLKNTLTSRTVNGLTIAVDEFGRITVNGAATANTNLSINGDVGIGAGTYVISGITGGSGSTYKLEVKADGAWGKVVTTQPLTLTVTEGITNFALVIYSSATLSNVVISPMICDASASNPTVFAPYENICPISGWTEVDVEQSGKNIYDIKGWLDKLSVPYTESNGYVSFTPTSPCYSSFFELPSGTKTLSFEISGESTGTNIRFRVKYANGTIDANATTKKTGDIVGVALNWSSVGTIKVKAQIEFGSTATPYEPYNGRSITISWQTEAGTVYGGKLDVLSGELTVDRAMVDLGTLTWTKSATTGGTNDRWICNAPNDAAVTPTASNKANFVCENYATLTANDTWFKRSTGISALKRSIYIYDPNTLDMTSAEFKSAMNGVQLVYELATPLEIQLTPNQVNSLLGVNNIWADSGDTEVVYRADTKKFIERLTVPDSADMIADSNITSGQYFMVGNSLYKATANIANGSAIIVGTNAIRKSLSEALNEINA